jgi:hypothetical protein
LVSHIKERLRMFENVVLRRIFGPEGGFYGRMKEFAQ